MFFYSSLNAPYEDFVLWTFYNLCEFAELGGESVKPLLFLCVSVCEAVYTCVNESVYTWLPREKQGSAMLGLKRARCT